MRINLAVMDWICTCMFALLQNENVNRPHTSVRRVKDLRRPDRQIPMKVLVEKGYKFVEHIMDSVCQEKCQQLGESASACQIFIDKCI